MESKSVKETLLSRRSIRRFEREPITKEQLDFIYEAIRNTPTSYNGQQFTVIDIDDQAIKEQLYEIIGQKQIKTCNHFLAFCIDYNRIAGFAKSEGVDMPPFYDTMDGTIVGVVDATLAMMSALTAADSVGLGGCCIGYARTANPEAVAKVLGLPQGVFVVCGLSLGVPREMPDLKPKMPASLLIHHNAYRTDDMLPELKAYDAEIKEYNASRSGTTSNNDWLRHILSYYTEALSYDMLKALADRGFNIKK
ncbi:MAG: NADPH-dependent oxidoreductase [Barnesiella sp.]|nr:NADPH-dependent oxidoreductase [Barnesiella sp.]